MSSCPTCKKIYKSGDYAKKELVQDTICCDFTVEGSTVATGSILYTFDERPSSSQLVASGYIKNSSPCVLIVKFLRGVTANGSGGRTVRTVNIPAGGCAAFTVSQFDTIVAFAPEANTWRHVNGEICLTPRYHLR